MYTRGSVREQVARLHATLCCASSSISAGYMEATSVGRLISPILVEITIMYVAFYFSVEGTHLPPWDGEMREKHSPAILPCNVIQRSFFALHGWSWFMSAFSSSCLYFCHCTSIFSTTQSLVSWILSLFPSWLVQCMLCAPASYGAEVGVGVSSVPVPSWVVISSVTACHSFRLFDITGSVFFFFNLNFAVYVQNLLLLFWLFPLWHEAYGLSSSLSSSPSLSSPRSHLRARSRLLRLTSGLARGSSLSFGLLRWPTFSTQIWRVISSAPLTYLTFVWLGLLKTKRWLISGNWQERACLMRVLLRQASHNHLTLRSFNVYELGKF